MLIYYLEVRLNFYSTTIYMMKNVNLWLFSGHFYAQPLGVWIGQAISEGRGEIKDPVVSRRWWDRGWIWRVHCLLLIRNSHPELAQALCLHASVWNFRSLFMASTHRGASDFQLSIKVPSTHYSLVPCGMPTSVQNGRTVAPGDSALGQRFAGQVSTPALAVRCCLFRIASLTSKTTWLIQPNNMHTKFQKTTFCALHKYV